MFRPSSWSLIVSWRARSTGDPNWLPPTRSWKLPGPAADGSCGAYPDITATGGYKRQSDGFNGAFLGLSVPLPLFDRRGGAVATSESQIRASEERLELTRRQVQADLRKAIESYHSLQLRGALLEEDILGGDPDLLEIAQVAYDAGEMTLVELLDAAEALRDAHSAEAKLRSDLWIAYYDLERAMGGFRRRP